MKGFAILCVVLGHIADGYLSAGLYPKSDGLLYGIYNVIYSFHMSLFMSISGYLYYTAYFGPEGDPDRKRIRFQILNQMCVYVVFSILWGGSRILIKLLGSGFMNKETSLTELLLIWVKPIDLYWYLYVLIIFYILFSVKGLIKQNRWMVLGLLAIIALAGQFINIEWFSINRILYYAFFFYIGIVGARYKDWIIGNGFLTFLSFITAILLSVFCWNWDLNRSKCINDIWGVNIVVALGTMLTCWYFFRNCRLSENRLLKICGKYSLEIYVVHCFFTAGLRTVLYRLGISNIFINIAINLTVSTAVPVLSAVVSYKWGIHDMFFRPYTWGVKRCSRHSSTI